MTKRTSLLLLAVVLLLAGSIRFWHLDARSIWFDEAFSLELATNCGFTELLDRTGRDVHPPGYYLLLKAWMWAVPRTEVGIRSLSAILGVCGVGLIFQVTRRLARLSRIPQIRRHSQSISFSAALLLATNAQHIYWSREARMYTLGVVLTLVSTGLMMRWLFERSWRWGFLTALSAAALMLTHNYGLFTVVCQAGCVVWYELIFHRRELTGRRRRGVVTALIPWGVAGWLYLPWYTVLLQQRARVNQEFWISAFSWKTIPIAYFLHVFPLNDVGPIIDWLVLLSAAVVLIAAGAVTFWFLVRSGWLRDTWAIPVILGPGPACIAVIVSIVSVSVIDTRHLSYCFPFLLMLFSGAIHWLLPREWAVYTMVFAIGWSLFGELQHRASLQTATRGGVRAAMQYLEPKIPESEIVVVQHPGIYHAVCFYLPARDRIKLYLPAGLPRHFYGRPIIRQEDLISGTDLDQLAQPRLMALDTGGFGGDQGFPLPERWKRDDQQVTWFQDVAWYQGGIGIAEYRPQTAADLTADSVTESASGEGVFRSSTQFHFDFTQHRYDREWFSLPKGVGESGRIRPTAAGLSFKTHAGLKRENSYLSVRQSLSGDFEIALHWLVPCGDGTDFGDMSLRLLLTQDNNVFDAEPVDIRINGRESTIELRCGRQSASTRIAANCSGDNQFLVSMQRVGGRLTLTLTMNDESCQCETRVSDQQMQFHLGDVISLSRPGPDSTVTTGVRCYLTSLQTSAESIEYQADDGVTDVTIAPSMRFWWLWGVAGLTLPGIVILLRRPSTTGFHSEVSDGDELA